MNNQQMTDPNKIDFDKDFNYIDWNNIDFLEGFFVKDSNSYVVKRKDCVPQIGGLLTIIAYKENLRRFLMSLQQPLKGAELWNSLDGNQLFDLSYQLARGQSLYFNLKDEGANND